MLHGVAYCISLIGLAQLLCFGIFNVRLHDFILCIEALYLSVYICYSMFCLNNFFCIL
jgi:hypothetical protein